ncbi:sialidase family protein [uncultured Winogradskyella sp.]|uniref:WD40/YVTN/BNR-like repeat-containing protein n=1 Tax=uncultured Winogradskyella sp. TaxID=395353 RepID=UPI00262F02B9|nr:sialidase family protein [uncultured Winogradskyella sp.]
MKKLIALILLSTIPNLLKAQISEDSIVTSLKKSFALTKFDRPTEIIKFNNDTILVAGFLTDLSNKKPRYEKKKNVLYKTSDGGKSWNLITFSGDAWIHCSYQKEDGKIWMSGSDNHIHYSDDYGENWSKKMNPFKPVNWVSSIHMIDSLNGISGGLSNGLATTDDNWKTTKQIESPINQGKFKILKQSARGKVHKIAVIDSIILINQNDYIFYSKFNKINWRKFNIPVSNFSINEKKNEITLNSRNGKLFVLDKKLNLIKESQEDYLWETITSDTTKLDLQTFFESEISSIKVTSTIWLFDKQVHLGASYKSDIQKGKIVDKKGILIFKSKDFGKRSLEISKNNIQALLRDKNLKVKLADLSKRLTFTTNDLKDYEKFVKKVKKERAEKENWGGNFTSQIALTNPEFRDFQNQKSYLKQNYIASVFNQVYLPYLLGQEEVDFIELRIESKNGNEIVIDNKKSEFYSLPWTITYGNKSMDTYNPKITELVRRILPTEFNNYEKLFGGQLIFKLIEEEIIDNLEYKNGY